MSIASRATELATALAKRFSATTPLVDKAVFPYAVAANAVPSTNNLTVLLPAITAQFGKNQVSHAETSYTAAASSIVDVWLRPDNTYLYETRTLSNYGDLPRYEGYVHVWRLQTSSSKVQGVYQRFQQFPVEQLPVTKAYDDYQFKNSHIIPGSWTPWPTNAAATEGVIYRTSLGDLWKCEAGGSNAGGELPNPTYNEEVNSGFDITPGGNASFSFRGRSGYKDVWRVSPRGGVNWYFSNIAAGQLAARFPDQVKAYLKAVAFHIVDNWVGSANYQEGRKVGGVTTGNRVWEAVSAGTAGVSSPFPTDAAIGTIVTDNNLTWRCVGPYAHSSQKLFWYDTDPTMRLARSPDSHDSYAATYVWAVWRYLQANPSDTAWLDEITTHAGGYSYANLLKEIIYTNLSIQIDAGLTKTFQGDGVPAGGTYAAQFFMDNCEVYAGYFAAEQIWKTYKVDLTYSAQMAGFKNGVTTALEGLWQSDIKAYKYVKGLVSNQPPVPGQSLFYPRVMSQAWGALWGVPLNAGRQGFAFDFMQANYSYWWARNDVDDLLALGAHYGLLSYTSNQSIRDAVLARIELSRLTAGQADIYVMDGAYYLAMRDNAKVNHLTWNGSLTAGSSTQAQRQVIPIALSDETSALTAGPSKITFFLPLDFIIEGVAMGVTVAQTSGALLTADVNVDDVSILGTKLSIDNTELASNSAATPATLSAGSSYAYTAFKKITVDIDQVGDGTAKGLKVYVIGRPA